VVYLVSLVSIVLNQTLGSAASTFFSYAALQLLVFALPIMIILFFVKRVEHTDFWLSTGFSRISWLRIVLFTLILHFLSFLLSTSLFRAGEYLTPKLPEAVRYDPGAVQTAFQGLPREAYWYMIFTSIVYAGFGEELAFRGYILTRLVKRSRLLAIIASAFMWSSLHLWYLPAFGSTAIWQHFDVIAIGLLFAIAYLRIRCILPFIAVHALTDILLPLSFLYPNGTVDLAAFVILLLGLFATAALGVRWMYGRLIRASTHV